MRPLFKIDFDGLDEREIELGLMDRFVRGDVDVAEVGFDLVEDLTFGAAEGLGHVRMYPESRVTDVFDALGQAASFGQDLVADGDRRFDPTGTFAVVARRTHGAFERLFDTFAGHDDQPEVVE